MKKAWSNLAPMMTGWLPVETRPPWRVGESHMCGTGNPQKTGEE